MTDFPPRTKTSMRSGRRVKEAVHMEIRQATALSDAEHQHLFGWGDNIFDTAALGLTWRQKDLHFLLFANQRLASHAALLTHVVDLDGADATVAGLGGVVTLPWAQGNGYARAVVTEAMNTLRAWSVDGGLLFCIPRMVPYYEKLGWSVFEGPVLINQTPNTIGSPLPVMVLPCTDRLRSTGRIRLNSLPW